MSFVSFNKEQLSTENHYSVLMGPAHIERPQQNLGTIELRLEITETHHL